MSVTFWELALRTYGLDALSRGAWACPKFGCLGCWCMWAVQWCPRPWDNCESRWGMSGTDFDAKYWFHKDLVCGMPCAGGCHWILSGCAFAGTVNIIYPWLGFSSAGVISLTLFNGWLFLAAVSQYRCMTTNPGAVPREAIPPPKEIEAHRERGVKIRKCPRTGVYKPLKSHFSSEIQRQVVRMDHHCPWINNTIGIGNQKFFILFLAYTWLACVLAIALASTKQILCSVDRKHKDEADYEPKPWCAKQSPERSLLTVLLVMAACLFALFTTCIGCEQITSIVNNDTYIDRLQARYRKGPPLPKPSAWVSLEEVFGNQGSRLWWVLPVRPRWKDPLKLLGYDLPTDTAEEEGRPDRYNDLEAGGGSGNVELSLGQSSARDILVAANGKGAPAEDKVPLLVDSTLHVK